MKLAIPLARARWHGVCSSRESSQLERRRDVTIIAGFPASGFIVLGADAEEGGSYAKSSVKKIAIINESRYKCLIGGAGDGRFIDLAVQHAKTQLAELESPVTLDGIRQTLEDIVTDIYVERIETFPPSQQGELAFDLLCATWAESGLDTQLIYVTRSCSLIRTTADAIGKGAYLARYLIETLDVQHETPLFRRHAERLCAYLLGAVKAHVKDCGGASQVITLGPGGTIVEIPKIVVAEDESSTDIVMDHVRFLFHWFDPVAWNFDLQKLDEVADTMIMRLKRLLREHHASLKQQSQPPSGPATQPVPPNSTHDPKDRPPSQE